MKTAKHSNRYLIHIHHTQWTQEEEAYANYIIKCFDSGLLDLQVYLDFHCIAITSVVDLPAELLRDGASLSGGHYPPHMHFSGRDDFADASLGETHVRPNASHQKIHGCRLHW